MGRAPAIPSPGAFLKTVFLAVEWSKRRACLTDFFSGPIVAAVAAPVPLPFPTPPTPCETLRPLRHAAISSHPSQYTSTRRVIQRVLQSSSLKHHEGVVFRSSFHPSCLDGSGTFIDRPAIDCRIRSLPRAFSHTNNQVPRVLIERQPISPPLQERFLYFCLGLTATYIYHAIPKEHRWNLGRVGPEVGRVAIRVDERQQANALAVECQHQSERSVLIAQGALILRQMLGLTGKISSSCLNSRAILELWNFRIPIRVYTRLSKERPFERFNRPFCARTRKRTA